MPVVCEIQFKSLDTGQFATLDYAVMAHAFATHRDLGSLADEGVYQSDFALRLTDVGFRVKREVKVEISYDSFVKEYFLDLVVNEMAVYELKTVAKLLTTHRAQLVNYLLMLDLSRGKIVNFRPMSVESEFVNAPLSGADRRSFAIDTSKWSGPGKLIRLTKALLDDWGTGLELPLYQQALIHLLGGEDAATKMLPMKRDSKQIGNQRFQLVDEDSAFRLTAFQTSPSGYASQISRLLNRSPLNAIHWIQLASHQVTCTTIKK